MSQNRKCFLRLFCFLGCSHMLMHNGAFLVPRLGAVCDFHSAGLIVVMLGLRYSIVSTNMLS